MAKDPSRGRAWRDQAGGVPRRQEGQPQWRREPTTSAAPAKRWSRKTKIAATALGFIIFCGLLVAAVLLLKVPSAAVLVPLYAGYEENLAVPANPYGRLAAQDLERLTGSGLRSFIWGSGEIRLKSEAREVRTDDPWDKDIDLGDFKEKTIVVFMALHGGADREGAYLLPADSNGRNDERNRLRLEKILERLAQIDHKKNKVLILDATQVGSDWPLGILQNGFARQLELLVDKIAVPRLVVISASDVNQRSWVSEEWRQTVFAHYVIEGLKGDARKQGTITAWDLYQYVQPKVEQWVRSNREASQRPVLLPASKGEELARNMDLVTPKEDYHEPNPREIPDFDLPEDLRKRWVTFNELEKEVPSPAVYAPQKWREYQAYLLRYEQICRAHDQTIAGRLAGKLTDMEDQLKRMRVEDLTSAQNTLPMPAAVGAGKYQPDRLAKQFEKLWDAPTASRGQVWEDILKTEKEKSAKQLLRAQLGERLIGQAINDPDKNLDKAAEIADVLKEAALRQPAELHFLIMLNRDRPKNLKEPAEEYYSAVKQALELRLLAEKAALNLQSDGGYPYSEHVYPWIKESVAKADQARQFGQDLLFSEDPDNWREKPLSDRKPNARVYFKQAEEDYKRAQEIGLAVRDALAARDLAYAELPAFSQWAASRRPSDQAARIRFDDDLLNSIEQLWKDVHRLDLLLEKPDVHAIKKAPLADADDSQPLSLLTKRVSQGMDDLRSKFFKDVKILAVNANLPTDWYDIEGALLVPFMDPTLRVNTDPTLRINLIKSSRRISRDYLEKTADQLGEASADEKKDEELAQTQAKRQARMALANLGQRWFEACKPVKLQKYDEVRALIPALNAPNWTEALTPAEEEIGARWQQMPGEIDSRADAADKSSLDSASQALQVTDRLGHLMDAGSVNLLKHRDPVGEHRRLMFGGLLSWQAQRTLEDHWFDFESNNKPYFQAAGTLYLKDAGPLVPQLVPVLKELQKKLDQPGKLLVIRDGEKNEGNSPLDITSERSFPVTYRIMAPKDEYMPPGFPVARVTHEENLEFLPPYQEGRVFYDFVKEKTATIPVSLKSSYLEKAESNPPKSVPSPERTSVKLAGVYRGQPLKKETPVNLYPLPEIVQVQPQAKKMASIAVRANPALFDQDPSKNAIVLILDCSGSMCLPYYPDEPHDGLPKFADRLLKDSRFDRAVVAIEKVLDEIKPGTHLSFWVFSDRAARGDFARQLRNLTWQKQEKAKLMEEIKLLHPWSETPLVRSMVEAKGDFQPHLTGFKTMIVLTDGEDDEFKEEFKKKQPGNNIARMAKEFKNSGIQLNLVFYEVSDPAEKDRIRKSFACIEGKDWPTPGKIYLEQDQVKLAASLRKALRPNLPYWVEKRSDDPTAPAGLKDSLEPSQTGSNDQWYKLAPGAYDLWAQKGNRERQKILFEPGDLLLLELTENLKFKRGLFCDDYPRRVNKEQQGWRAAVLQNKRVGERKLQMLMTLEFLHDLPTLQQVKPYDVWFKIEPTVNAKALFAVRWRYEYGYPAPGWGFDVPEWPVTSPDLDIPQIRVWWSPDRPARTSYVLQGGDLKSASALNPWKDPIEIEGDKDNQLESVTVEKRRVDGQIEEQTCLVVRMKYAKDKPVWVKVESNVWKAEGSEHRFYGQAHKYTGIFWPVPANADETLAKLSFISLDSFQREAKERGFYLELKNPDMAPNEIDRPNIKVSLD